MLRGMTRARLALLLVITVAAATALFVLRPKVDLIVVNTTGAPVRVVANGHKIQVAAGAQHRLERLGANLSLRATATEGGASLAEIDTSCRGAETWVFSVAPVTTWWAVSKGYGDMAHVASSCAPFAAAGLLFPLGDDFLPVIDQPMPLDLRVKKGVTGAVKKGLWSDAYAEQAHPRRAWLAVHTNAAFTVRLLVNGEELATLPRGAVAHLEVRPGPVALRAIAVDGPGAKQTFEVQGVLEGGPPLAQAPTYVWDVDGSSRFKVVSRRYGVDPDADGPPPPPRPFESPGGLFRLPPGFYHEVDAPLPDRFHEARTVEFLWCDRMLIQQAAAGTPGIPPELLNATPGKGRRRDRKATQQPPPPDSAPQDSPFPPVVPDSDGR